MKSLHTLLMSTLMAALALTLSAGCAANTAATKSDPEPAADPLGPGDPFGQASCRKYCGKTRLPVYACAGAQCVETAAAWNARLRTCPRGVRLGRRPLPPRPTGASVADASHRGQGQTATCGQRRSPNRSPTAKSI